MATYLKVSDKNIESCGECPLNCTTYVKDAKTGKFVLRSFCGFSKYVTSGEMAIDFKDRCFLLTDNDIETIVALKDMPRFRP